MQNFSLHADPQTQNLHFYITAGNWVEKHDFPLLYYLKQREGRHFAWIFQDREKMKFFFHLSPELHIRPSSAPLRWTPSLLRPQSTLKHRVTLQHADPRGQS